MGQFKIMSSQGVKLLRLYKIFHEKSLSKVPVGSTHMKQQIRWHGDDVRMSYRKLLLAHEKDVKLSNIYGAVFWWWLTYNFITADYEELLGPHVPDPSKWTDKELGIPPLDNLS